MRSFMVLVVAILGFTPAAALAGANKTWVSGTGNDTGSCAITAPCKSFQYALGQTSAGGEIDVKDAGGFGTLVINKAITIVAAPGVLATISVPSGGTGIAVNAGYNDTVILRGLTIDGHGVGLNGLEASVAAQLIVRDTVVQGMTGVGLDFDNGDAGAAFNIVVSNVTAQNNGIGVRKLAPVGGLLNGHFEDSQFTKNTTGLLLVNGNSQIVNCVFEDNSTGLDSSNESAILSRSTFLLDGTSKFGGATYSTGDNLVQEFASPQGSLKSISKR